jgi:hypothetical protein
MADLLAPAIFYAEDGFPVSDVIARAWNGATSKLKSGPNAAAVFLPNGRAPRTGELFKNPDLAGTMRAIGEKGVAGFYEGRTADAILAVSRERARDRRRPAGTQPDGRSDPTTYAADRMSCRRTRRIAALDAEPDGAYLIGETASRAC